jgi:hypothetical protein
LIFHPEGVGQDSPGQRPGNTTRDHIDPNGVGPSFRRQLATPAENTKGTQLFLLETSCVPFFALISKSREAGIYFRGGEKAFAALRSRIEKNRIVDSGGDKGVAIDVTGKTEGVFIVNNELKETRSPASRIGIRIGAQTRDTRCTDNRIEGFATEILDLRKK